MVYESRDQSLGPHKLVWKLEYTSKRNWTKTLIENPNAPSSEGTMEQFDDTLLTITLAADGGAPPGEQRTIETEYPDAPVAPEPWLMLDNDLRLLDYGYQAHDLRSDGTLVLALDGRATCEQVLLLPLDACDVDDPVNVQAETVFTTRVEPPLPLGSTAVVEDDMRFTSSVVELVLDVDE